MDKIKPLLDRVTVSLETVGQNMARMHGRVNKSLVADLTAHLQQSTPMELFLQEEVKNLRIERVRLEMQLHDYARCKRIADAVATAAQQDPAMRQIMRLAESDGR